MSHVPRWYWPTVVQAVTLGLGLLYLIAENSAHTLIVTGWHS
jgi:hypothetical protein